MVNIPFVSSNNSTPASGSSSPMPDSMSRSNPELSSASPLQTSSGSSTTPAEGEPFDPETALRPIGIVNEQNTCFLNSTFQALSATRPLISLLYTSPNTGNIYTPTSTLSPPPIPSNRIPVLLPEALEPPIYPLLPVSRTFLTAIQKAWRMKDAGGGTIGYDEFNSNRSMRLNYLLREMAKKYDQYDDYMQQDAHELLRHLLDSMEMEEKDVIKILQPPTNQDIARKSRSRGRPDGISPLPSPLPSRSASPAGRPQVNLMNDNGISSGASETPISDAIRSTEQLMKEIEEDKRLIPFVDVLFGGALASVIVCEHCKAVSHTYEGFLDISLSLRGGIPRTKKRDRLKAVFGLKPRISSSKAASNNDVSTNVLSESELSDSERHDEEYQNKEADRRRSMDTAERPEMSEVDGGNVNRHSSLKFGGLKGKSSFSWRKKSRPASSSSGTPGNTSQDSEKIPPPPTVKSAPTSPLLGTHSRHGPTRAQMAYIRRLLAPPKGMVTHDADPLAKIRAANEGDQNAINAPLKSGLEQSLDAFTSVEILEGENAFACKRCWKIKTGRYKSKHPTVMEEDEQTDSAVSPLLSPNRLTSPPIMIETPESSQNSLIPSSDSPTPGHLGRATSTASRSSAGRPMRAPSPLRSHVEARSNSNVDQASLAATESSSLISDTLQEPRPLIPESILDDDSDGLSNTSTSSEEESHIADAIPADARPGLHRRKSQHYVMRRAFKRYLIAKAPEILVFHFKRFKQTQKAMLAFTSFYDLKKVDDYISFPESLDLAPYMAPDRKDYKITQTPNGPRAPFMDWASPDQGPQLEPVMHKLYATVVHLGSIDSGHYIAYVLVDPTKMFGTANPAPHAPAQPEEGMKNLKLEDTLQSAQEDAKTAASNGNTGKVDRRVWCFCSDTSIRLADLDEVLTAKAYLCFYEKSDPDDIIR